MKKPGEQFLEGGLALGDLHPALGGNRVPEVVTGPVVRHIFKRADIVHTRAEAPHLVGTANDQERDRGQPSGELRTSQSHLHTPTLNRYARGDVPEWDNDYIDEETGESYMPYEPETYQHQGKTWIEEGHHRIVADRLGQ